MTDGASAIANQEVAFLQLAPQWQQIHAHEEVAIIKERAPQLGHAINLCATPRQAIVKQTGERWSSEKCYLLKPSWLSCRFVRVFRLVDVLADKRHHVGRTIYAGQARIEDEFRHSRGCLDLGLKNIRLQRVQETLLEQLGGHLIRHGLPGLDEHLVGDALRLRGEDRHTDRREYVEVVRLSRQKCLAVVGDRRELHAGGVDRLAL